MLGKNIMQLFYNINWFLCWNNSSITMESNILQNTLPVTLGTDHISNESVLIDIAQCGNILIVGATKQGKSHWRPRRCKACLIWRIVWKWDYRQEMEFEQRQISPCHHYWWTAWSGIYAQIQKFEICFRPQSLWGYHQDTGHWTGTQYLYNYLYSIIR